MSNRWKMNRIGFVNFWLYDEEDFSFEDGKLLLPHTHCPVFLRITFFKFQKKVACCFLSTFFPKKVILHPAIAGSERIQSAWCTVTVKHKWKKVGLPNC